MYFINEEVKETILYLSKGTVKGLWFYFILIKYKYKMTQYSTWNVKLSNSQRNKLKPAIQNGTEVTINISSNLIEGSNDKIIFPINYY